MNDFDRHHEQMQRMVRSAQRAALFGTVVCGLLWLSCVGAVCYVAWHFLQKVW